jgi:tRNA-Thr(GGU) m(6)t(6)A37 methyltransferase TsaA
MNLKPVGVLKTCYPDKFGVPRQPGLVRAAWGELVFEREWQPELALEGLEQFSHVWLIFGFHLNTNEVYRPKVHPPRMHGGSIGVFATRSPHRPNPVGLSLVKIEKREGAKLWVSGPDLVDGTPIFDVKPYLPMVESIPTATAGWAGLADTELASVEWSEEALLGLQDWLRQKPTAGEKLKSLIEDSIALDPRPLVYRGFEGEKESKYRQVHAVRIEGGDVHFEFRSPKQARIVKVLARYSRSE